MPSPSSRQKFRETIRQDHPSAKASPANAKTSEVRTRPFRSRSFGRLFREFLRLLGDQRRPISVSLAILTVATLLKLVPPVATKIAIDYALVDQSLPAAWADRLPLPTDRFQLLTLLAVSVVVTSLLCLAIQMWSRWRVTKSVQRVQIAVRRKAYEHTLRLPLHRIYDLKSGGSASLVRYDAGAVGELIFSMIYNPWQAIIQLVGVLTLLLWVDWRLCVAGLLLVPLIYLSHRIWITRLRPLYRGIRKQRQEIDSLVTEAFSGIRVVRAFGRQRNELARFTRANHLLVRQQLYAWCWSRIVDLFWGAAMPIASMTILLYGGYRVLRGELSLGDLTMLIVYLAMLLSPLASLANSASTFQDTLAGLDRILDLFGEIPASDTLLGGRRLNPAEPIGNIALQGVSFIYPGSDQYALADINLEIRSGETVALVGSSGAGKTTLSNLVARFYDPVEGVITLGGTDLREIRCEDFRRQLAIVEQEVFLFDGTISDNISYARHNATSEEIRQAAVAAGADEFITSFKLSYETLVGERGVQLSGGQRQRIAIARAVLANPQILILDEATSNVDTESELLIQKSLAKMMQNRTTLIIAHRMSSLIHADKIVVLDKGRIVESGTHHELMSLEGRYRKMVDLQREIVLPS